MVEMATKPTRRQSLEDARDVAARAGWHPIEFLIEVAASGRLWNPCTTCGDVHRDPIPGGCQAKSTCLFVDPKMRLDAAKEVLPYCAPKLSSLEVSGPAGGPVQHAHATLDLTRLLADPALLQAAQRIALTLADREPTINVSPVD